MEYIDIVCLDAVSSINQCHYKSAEYILSICTSTYFVDINVFILQVRLRSTGIHDPPLIDPRYLTSEQDVDTLLASIR